MNLLLSEFSIVIVGEDCNPTILNPDFLKYQSIVPEDWGWKLDAPPITTPGFAMVAYDSGVTIKVEPNRLLVTQIGDASRLSESHIIDIATKYIQCVPHVRYVAVGNNFRGFAPSERPYEFLKARFLRSGPWDDASNPLHDVSLSFIYQHDEARLAITLATIQTVREVDGQSQQMLGLDISGNYHRTCKSYPTDKEVIAHIGKASADLEHFMSRITPALLH